MPAASQRCGPERKRGWIFEILRTRGDAILLTPIGLDPSHPSRACSARPQLRGQAGGAKDAFWPQFRRCHRAEHHGCCRVIQLPENLPAAGVTSFSCRRSCMGFCRPICSPAWTSWVVTSSASPTARTCSSTKEEVKNLRQDQGELPATPLRRCRSPRGCRNLLAVDDAVPA